MFQSCIDINLWSGAFENCILKNSSLTAICLSRNNVSIVTALYKRNVRSEIWWLSTVTELLIFGGDHAARTSVQRFSPEISYKYLIYWMDCHEIRVFQTIYLHYFDDPLTFPLMTAQGCGFEWTVSATFGWVAIKFRFKHSCLPSE